MVKRESRVGRDADYLFARGTAAARAGQRRRALRLFTQLVTRYPDHEQGWLWLAYLSQDPARARLCLRRVLQINPRNAQAVRRLRRLDSRSVARRTSLYSPHVLGYWLLAALALLLLGGLAARLWSPQGPESSGPVTPYLPPTAVVVPTPTPAPAQLIADALPRLEQAWQARDWPSAAALLDGFALLDPSYPGLDAARCDTYVNWARDLAAQGKVQEAYRRYRYATQVCRDPRSARAERLLALRYLSGRWRYEHGMWQGAVVALEEVHAANPDYADTRSLLAASYVAHARSLLDEGRLSAARMACEAAVNVKPDDDDATALCKRIRAMPTPTPTPVPFTKPRKLIEVDISEQRMYVWEGKKLLYKWVCSTGEPGRDTAVGRFRILDKIPEAWASTWNLRMPYWLGIYYVGPLENGIHALPILPNGQTLWAGYLGSRVSFGCIILSTENARTLYYWADIGTPVWIHR